AAAKRCGSSGRGFVSHAVPVGASPAARPALAAGELPDHEPDHEREEDPAGEITIPDEPAHEAEDGEQPEEGDVPGHEPLHGLHPSLTLPCPRLSPTSCSLPSEQRVRICSWEDSTTVPPADRIHAGAARADAHVR